MTKCKKRSMMLLKIESIRGEQLSRAAETHGLAWSCVQLPRNGIQLHLSVSAQVSALGQLLSQQPIGVLVDPPLPRAVRVGEVHLHPRGFSQSLVLGHFS